jgi:hypothetical protein
MRDRRFEPRFSAAQQVRLSWPDGAASGTLLDLSRSGARVGLDQPVRINTAVRLTLDQTEASAQVRSCVKESTGYVLGVEFDPECQGVLKRKR